MATYELATSLRLARPRPEVFAFFGDAGNLDALTPPWLKFRILTPRPIAMRPGTLIDYKLSIHGIPVRWRTAITTWAPPDVFVDEQLRGPYRRWVHTHLFSDEAGGTRVEDRVLYRVPGGALVNALIVAPDLRRVFAYRLLALRERLDPGGSGPPHVTIRRIDR
jgi:ligand-binding SRPBCC domain-containing protein